MSIVDSINKMSKNMHLLKDIGCKFFRNKKTVRAKLSLLVTAMGSEPATALFINKH